MATYGDARRGTKCYTDGKTVIYLTDNAEVPEGFHPGNNTIFSDKVKKSISNNVKNLWLDEDYRKRQSESHKLTEEKRSKGLRGTTAGKICLTDGNIDRFVFETEAEILIKQGWRRGSKKKGKPVTTPVWNRGLTKETDERVALNGKRIGKSLVGNIPWNKNLTAETDTRVKMLARKQIGKIVSEKTRYKISQSNQGRIQSQEEKIKRAQSLSNFWKTHPEELEKRCKFFKEYYSDPERRKQMSLRAQQVHKEHPEIVDRIKETKRKNGTFNTSRAEIQYYAYLLTKYDELDIEREHKDDLYPFYCDFYIRSEKLYIELNLHPTHLDHPFDPNNEDDIELLRKLQSKDDQWSKNVVDVWTKRDYNKFNIAKQNKLNYKAIYYEEFNNESRKYPKC